MDTDIARRPLVGRRASKRGDARIGGQAGAVGAVRSPRVTRPMVAVWKRPQVAFGVLLTLGCAGVAVALLPDPAPTVPLWSAAYDLPAGTVLVAADLVRVDATLTASDRYASTSAMVLGRTLDRRLVAGELVPVTAVLPAYSGDTGSGVSGPGSPSASTVMTSRLVTVPVDRLHLPPGLARGDLVDIWVTPEAVPEHPSGAPELVLAMVVVDAAPSADNGLSSGDRAPVVLAVSQQQAPVLVKAARSGAVDLVRASPAQEQQ